MDPFALVLNAGSSSLKFCLFQEPRGSAWRVEAQGQIEGIGTAPHFVVKYGEGNKRVDEKLDGSVRTARRRSTPSPPGSDRLIRAGGWRVSGI